MQIIGASCIFLCDKEFVILKNAGLLFDSKIRAIGDYETLRQTHLDAEAHFYEGGVILPTFANPHIHFEFSANETSFAYGGFDRWLDSVMAKRDDVLAHSTQAIKEGISEQIRSGVGMVGAISSYGDDLELLAQSQLKVVYFNEAIGSNPSAIDFLYSHILKRIDDSMQYKSPRFRPGLAIHSPYSVHYVLAKKLLKLARDSNLPTSVHFLESEFEREWLESESGWFKQFYQKTLGVDNPRALYSIDEFLELFSGLDTLFVHTLAAKDNEWKKMCESGKIITCPRSNRLLNNRLLDIESVGLNNLAIATDGKSSNINLNYLDELRMMLFGYANYDCALFAKDILAMATREGALALGFDSGVLKEGMNADFSIFRINGILQENQEALGFLLHAKEAEAVYLDGINILR